LRLLKTKWLAQNFNIYSNHPATEWQQKNLNKI